MRQFNQKDWDLVAAILDQLQRSPVWNYRADAAKLLALMGNFILHIGRGVKISKSWSTDIWSCSRASFSGRYATISFKIVIR